MTDLGIRIRALRDERKELQCKIESAVSPRRLLSILIVVMAAVSSFWSLVPDSAKEALPDLITAAIFVGIVFLAFWTHNDELKSLLRTAQKHSQESISALEELQERHMALAQENERLRLRIENAQREAALEGALWAILSCRIDPQRWSEHDGSLENSQDYRQL